MAYKARDYSYLIGIDGLSETLLKNHFTLYQGYVTNTNKVIDSLTAMLKEGKTTSPEYAELKRRFGWEFNGMRLHEFYFENLICPTPRPDAVTKKLADAFGSYEDWGEDFKATGAIRGIGWVILYRDDATRNLCNLWVNEHDVGHLAGCSPILVMDVFEHAFITDYGLKRADYISAFFENIDWNRVARRLE